MQAYIVGRRFYRDVDISIGESLTFRAHTDERGYQCTAAFNADNSTCSTRFSSSHLSCPVVHTCTLSWQLNRVVCCHLRISTIELVRAVVCGQLPEAIATALEPLLATLAASATITALPQHPASPVPILLTLKSTAAASRSACAQKLTPAERIAQQRMVDALIKAAQNTETSVSEGTGAALRRHYARMFDSALTADAHLFVEADRRVAQACGIVTAAAQGLLLRLRQRKGPWFRVGALAYADVADYDAAVAELRSEGLLDVLAAPAAPGARLLILRLISSRTSVVHGVHLQGHELQLYADVTKTWLCCSAGTACSDVLLISSKSSMHTVVAACIRDVACKRRVGVD